ncbi:hypothetical protein [Brevibacillus marinus]|uniref:hypothetical protein n=1 Tax=Brevibacillus marinus TaxID=2496837 RepID=UPI0013DF38D5|nr:hypothetical protein [Brevibacillus marinus]
MSSTAGKIRSHCFLWIGKMKKRITANKRSNPEQANGRLLPFVAGETLQACRSIL